MSATYRVSSPGGVVRVLDAARYRVRHPLARLATCGACGRTWDDAVCTRWTPAPSGRCPWEDRHYIRQPKRAPTGFPFDSTFRAVYEQHAEHDGKPVTVTGFYEDHDPEVGPMLNITLRDGTTLIAWPEELTAVTRLGGRSSYSAARGMGWIWKGLKKPTT